MLFKNAACVRACVRASQICISPFIFKCFTDLLTKTKSIAIYAFLYELVKQLTTNHRKAKYLHPVPCSNGFCLLMCAYVATIANIMEPDQIAPWEKSGQGL